MNIISWRKPHELLIIETWLTPLWNAEKFPPYCGYILQIVTITPSLKTACLLPFQWKIGEKHSHLTSHWVTSLNFRKSKAKKKKLHLLLSHKIPQRNSLQGLRVQNFHTQKKNVKTKELWQAAQSLKNFETSLTTKSNNLPTKLALPYHPRSSLINLYTAVDVCVCVYFLPL